VTNSKCQSSVSYPGIEFSSLIERSDCTVRSDQPSQQTVKVRNFSLLVYEVEATSRISRWTLHYPLLNDGSEWNSTLLVGARHSSGAPWNEACTEEIAVAPKATQLVPIADQGIWLFFRFRQPSGSWTNLDPSGLQVDIA
jgi:hypothetical protein